MAINEKYRESIIQTIVMMYQGGISVPSIVAEIDGVTARDVRLVLKEQGVLQGPGRRPTVVEALDESTIEAMLADYYDGMRVNAIVDKYRLQRIERLYTILRELGQPVRVNLPERLETRRMQMDSAVDLYKKGLPIWKIVEETGIDQPSLHTELHKRGIPGRRRTA